MKKLIDSIPVILLVSLVTLSFIKEPNLAQSLIIGFIAALVGYRYYIVEQEKPDLEAIFEERIKLIEKDNTKDAEFIKAELKNIKEGYSKISVANQMQPKKVTSAW